MSQRALRYAGWLGLASSLLGAGCDSNVDEQLALAGLSVTCHINSDCAASLICAFERCHQQCASSRDCQAGARCVAGRQGRPVCQLPDEQSCAETGCPGAQRCGADLQCRDACESARQCVSEQVCSAGTCADVVELDEQGELARAPDAAVPCVLDSDCPGPLVCVEGSCSVACVSSSDCRTGWSCTEDGVCAEPPRAPSCLRNSDCPEPQLCVERACREPEPGATPACEYDSECALPGQRCAGGECRCECQSDVDCPAGRACSDGCQCVANRVLVGNVIVANGDDLAALQDVVEIQGQLGLSIWRIGEFHLPKLRKASVVSTSGPPGNRYVLDALEEVTEYASFYSECRAPRLKTTPSLNLNAGLVERWELPELTRVGQLLVANNPKLVQAFFPKLEAARQLSINTNPLLERAEFPLLRELEALQMSSNDKLEEFALPLAELTTDLRVGSNPLLRRFALPKMQSISGWIDFSSDVALADLDISALEQGDYMNLSQLPSLKSVDLGRLKKLGVLNVVGTGLTRLEGLYPIPPGALQELTAMTFSFNAALPECTLQSFAQALRDQWGWSGTLNTNDNLACCAGAPCP